MALSISNLKTSSEHYQSSLSRTPEMADAPPYPPPLPMQLQQYEGTFTSTPRRPNKNLSLRQQKDRFKAMSLSFAVLLMKLRLATKNIVSRGYKFVIAFSFKAKRYCIQYYTFVSPAVFSAVTSLRAKSKLIRLNRPFFLSSKLSKKLFGTTSARLQKTRIYIMDASYMPHKAFTAVGITAVTTGLISSLLFSSSMAVMLMIAGIIQLGLGTALKNKIHLRS